jgi:hypothetical protein
MFSRLFSLQAPKQVLQRALDAPWRALVGVAFVLMAMVAIQYEEKIAPGVNRISDGWSSVADFSRKLTSFTL